MSNIPGFLPPHQEPFRGISKSIGKGLDALTQTNYNPLHINNALNAISKLWSKGFDVATLFNSQNKNQSLAALKAVLQFVKHFAQISKNQLELDLVNKALDMIEDKSDAIIDNIRIKSDLLPYFLGLAEKGSCLGDIAIEVKNLNPTKGQDLEGAIQPYQNDFYAKIQKRIPDSRLQTPNFPVESVEHKLGDLTQAQEPAGFPEFEEFPVHAADVKTDESEVSDEEARPFVPKQKLSRQERAKRRKRREASRQKKEAEKTQQRLPKLFRKALYTPIPSDSEPAFPSESNLGFHTGTEAPLDLTSVSHAEWQELEKEAAQDKALSLIKRAQGFSEDSYDSDQENVEDLVQEILEFQASEEYALVSGENKKALKGILIKLKP